ncbi:hemophore-related protein [Mycobacterium sp.]|uniref:hemophore-related protein n=1 Tax=Mycobacterium sp. TaxID=1785 RepID=UPI001273C2F8|nr:hemophore-related protein [Mycobacterium sp.]KAA8963894.1 MAG: hemophore-related protein [Mycobacterium sp.]
MRLTARLTSLGRLAVAVGGLALLGAGGGVASADPDLGPIVNTTCSYPQAVAALNAQDPAAAAQFNSSPLAQSALREFLASPPSRRMQIAEQLQSSPAAQRYFGIFQEVANTCNNY